MDTADFPTFLKQSALVVAPKLIGCRFYSRQNNGQLVGGVVTETEAYTEDDAASHSYRGQTARNQVMFGPSGRLYVYFTYGIHWCANVVAGSDGHGEAVLIRSLLVDKGLDIIHQRRGNRPDHELTNGPAKICQALDITGQDNGAALNQDKFLLLLPPESSPPLAVTATTRIGIKNDTDRLWRFVADT